VAAQTHAKAHARRGARTCGTAPHTASRHARRRWRAGRPAHGGGGSDRRRRAHRVDADDEQPARRVDGLQARQVDGRVAGQRIGPRLPRVQLVPERADLRIAHADDRVLALQRLLQPCAPGRAVTDRSIAIRLGPLRRPWRATSSRGRASACRPTRRGGTLATQAYEVTVSTHAAPVRDTCHNTFREDFFILPCRVAEDDEPCTKPRSGACTESAMAVTCVHGACRGRAPGCDADSMNGSGDWLSSCLPVPSTLRTKARTCAHPRPAASARARAPGPLAHTPPHARLAADPARRAAL